MIKEKKTTAKTWLKGNTISSQDWSNVDGRSWKRIRSGEKEKKKEKKGKKIRIKNAKIQEGNVLATNRRVRLPLSLFFLFGLALFPGLSFHHAVCVAIFLDPEVQGLRESI